MIRLGLCSGACITRSAKEVLDLASSAGLDAVEWAQDVHLGASDRRMAEELMITTLTAGLTTASYATLYRAGADDEGHKRFDELLAIASTLQSPLMRIYACCERQADNAADYAGKLVDELRRLGDKSAERGITLCLSLGRGTGFASYERGSSLVAQAEHSFVRLAWEDLPYERPSQASAALESSKRGIATLIARCAGKDGKPRAVADELDAWRTRIAAFKSAEIDPKMGSFVLLGGQRGDGEAGATSLAADADAMRGLVAEFEPQKKR